MLTHGSLFSGIGSKNTYLCQVCNKSFVSYNPTPKFCSNKCKSIFQEADIDYKKVVEMYENGHTQVEIAAFFNVKQKVIYSAFKRNGYKCRIPKKRNQFGSNNDSWKGDSVSYTAFHCRVYAAKGKASKCDVCGADDSTKHFDWACIGDYSKIEDYKSMCRNCHFKHDMISNNFSNNNRTPNINKKKLIDGKL